MAPSACFKPLMTYSRLSGRKTARLIAPNQSGIVPNEHLYARLKRQASVSYMGSSNVANSGVIANTLFTF